MTLKMLEPYAVKVARTVLRGLRWGNPPRLPDAIEALLHFRLQKKLKNAELRNLNVEANEKVIGNWIAWSDKMEERIQDLEKNNKEMRATIIKQRERINDLEVYIEELEHKLKKYQQKK